MKAPLLTLLAGLVAADAPPNTLTPEETAAGWVLLFDGQEADRLRHRGQVALEKGQLVLGGSVGSRLGPNDPLPAGFTFEAEYRIPADTRAILLVEKRATPSPVLARSTLPQLAADPDTWHRLSVTCAYDAATGIRTLTRTVTVAGQPPTSETLGHYQEEMNVGVWIEVMPGNRLHFQNLKLRAEQLARRGWRWLYAAGGVTAALVLAVLLWRRYRRAPVAA